MFPHEGARMTYAEGRDRFAALARALLDHGVGPGDHVGLLAEARVEWPVAQMAIAMMGAVVVPLNTHYRRDDLAYAPTNAEVTALILSDSFRCNLYLDMVRAVRREAQKLDLLISLDSRMAR